MLEMDLCENAFSEGCNVMASIFCAYLLIRQFFTFLNEIAHYNLAHWTFRIISTIIEWNDEKFRFFLVDLLLFCFVLDSEHWLWLVRLLRIKELHYDWRLNVFMRCGGDDIGLVAIRPRYCGKAIKWNENDK